MGSRKDLQEKLRDEFGSDEYPLVKTKKISALSLENLRKMLIERDIPIQEQDKRKFLEDLLKAAQDGDDEVVTIDLVNIDSMSVGQLQEALSKLSQPRKNIREIQQEIAENCGFLDEVIWDLLPKKDENVMKEKIKQLIPDQEKGQKAIDKMRADMFTNIWAQRKYTNGNSFTYIFYVMVTDEIDFNIAKDSTKFSCHPVFRCRKCVAEDDSSKCCMIYVDETGRVYQNWKSFVEDNVLPAGTMVTPRHGIYNFDKKDDVILDVYCTPSGSAGAKAMSVAQTSSAVLGIGAATIPIAALALPVAAPVMAGAALIGLGVGAFSAITSALNLRDRAVHEQSISVTDSQARGSYLGIAGGVLGMAAAGATRVMTSMAAAGRATVGIEVLVNGINISTIILSGSGVANGVLDLIFKYRDDESISTLDILQLSASLVLFTHSVYNFQLASQIANEARTNSIKSYRETLSNRQRKMFDKMSKETVRIRGDSKGKMDIIRNINKIPDRQYLNDLFKINKQMNGAKARPAFGSSAEGVVINNELPVDTGVLRQSVQHQQGPNILEQVTNPIPSTYNSGDAITTQTPQHVRMLFASNGVGSGPLMEECNNLQDTFNEHPNVHSSAKLMHKLKNLAIGLGPNVLVHLGMYGELFLRNIADGQKFQDVILSMAENFPEKTFRYLLTLTQQFIDEMLEAVLQELKTFIPTESILYRIVKHVLRNYQDLSYDFIVVKGNEILLAIRIYFLKLKANNNGDKKQKCADCEGHYFICNL